MAKPATIQQLTTTDKAYSLRKLSKNDDIFSKEIGISKVTMYTRLQRSNWKTPEITQINHLFESKNLTL
jgi:hypothetical protein